MVWGRFNRIQRHFNGIFSGSNSGNKVITVSNSAYYLIEDYFTGSRACFPSQESNLNVFYAGFNGF